MPPICLVYYCSGHGYGHATRVSAFACHLLSLPDRQKPLIHIVSSAPEHVFADSIARGALYRYAEIDPVIVQPLAYRVDRQKSVQVLKAFLAKKEVKLETERKWLLSIKAHGVLSDAAFLGCLAAKAAGIPSILITNFTFDSVYSYLSTDILDASSSPELDHLHPDDSHHDFVDLIPDIPVPLSELAPLVEQIYAGYRCANLLFLLPGHIPIPSFSEYPALPSSGWIDVRTRAFHPQIAEFLSKPSSPHKLHPRIPFPPAPATAPTSRPIISAPLLVRPPTSSPSVYTPEGRSHFLSCIGVPADLHDPNTTKILVVSFGGQVFRRPSCSGSRSPSRSSRNCTPEPASPQTSPASPTKNGVINGLGISEVTPDYPFLSTEHTNSNGAVNGTSVSPLLSVTKPDSPPIGIDSIVSPRLATPSHIWVPGAPPASKPTHSPTIPAFDTIPPTPLLTGTGVYPNLESGEEVESPRLLPDSSWIAIVCGVSKEQWKAEGEDEDSEVPDGFFVAPKDVYMPDLTAIADVLLGKLGYGTVSECVDACTPFVYVSRPLFIEEHGLRYLLDREGVGLELSRRLYEDGEWAAAVNEAWTRGESAKARKRADMSAGIGLKIRIEEGKDMARTIVNWVQDWWVVP